jgi:hypothetical protein
VTGGKEEKPLDFKPTNSDLIHSALNISVPETFAIQHRILPL